MSSWVELGEPLLWAALCAMGAGAVLAWTTVLIWPSYAAAFAGLAAHAGSGSEEEIARHRFRAFRRVVVFAVACLGLAPVLLFELMMLDPWVGIITALAVLGHTVGAAVFIPRAMRRNLQSGRLSIRDNFDWLREFGLTTAQIGVLTKSRVLSNTLIGALYVIWIAAFLVPLRYFADSPGAALGAALIVSLLFCFIAPATDYLDGRLRVANQLLLHLTAACRPNSGNLPVPLRVRQDPDINPNDLWHHGLPRDRAALLASVGLLRDVLRRRTRRWTSLDQTALLDAAQPILDDLASLAASTRPIASSPVITDVVRLAFLGDTRMLRQGWAKPHRASDSRAWTRRSPRRIATVTIGSIGATAAAVGSVVAVVNALTS